MGTLKQPLLRLAFGALCAAWACMAFAPVADAQFFWWFDQPKSAQKPRVMNLYIDRTSATLAERQLVLAERLASLAPASRV